MFLSLAADNTFTIDWTVIILALIAAAPTWLAYGAKKSGDRAAQFGAKAAEAGEKAEAAAIETHKEVNSRRDKDIKEQEAHTEKYLKMAVDAAFAAGVKQAEDTIKAVMVAPKREALIEETEAVKKLEEIEKHTEATAENTAKTEKNVTEAIKKPKTS